MFCKLLQRFSFWFFFILGSCVNFSLQAHSNLTLGIRVSVLTCGTGEDLYSIYGHSALRIVDSMRGTDVVYNYGTFNFGDPDFYMKFTRGKLLYYLNDEAFADFLSLYQSEQRSMYEQVLDLNPSEAVMVQDFVTDNLKPENKYYKYDFLYDNCSTRIRDIFSILFGDRLSYGEACEADSMTFRTILNHYERNLHWERVGINLLMSNEVDKKMSNLQSMFLPDYLMKGFAGAELDGRRLVKSTLNLLPQTGFKENIPNAPKLWFWVVSIFFIFLSFAPSMRNVLLYFDVLFFLILGLLGCLMLFMWFGTEHAVCTWNRNLLWAFPLHVIFAFMLPRQNAKVAKYARYAGWLIILSLLYNFFATQKYIHEFVPLILLSMVRLNSYTRTASFKSFTSFRTFGR